MCESVLRKGRNTSVKNCEVLNEAGFCLWEQANSMTFMACQQIYWQHEIHSETTQMYEGLGGSEELKWI